jgi:hypothetical protein
MTDMPPYLPEVEHWLQSIMINILLLFFIYYLFIYLFVRN